MSKLLRILLVVGICISFGASNISVAQAAGWAPTGSMHTSRYGQTGTLLSNSKVLVTGGVSGTFFLTSAEIYDVATGAWTSTGSMNRTRAYYPAILLQNGKVLVAGGYSDDEVSAELYDPATGVWTPTGSMNVARYGFSGVLLPNGKALVSGGTGGPQTATAELYDPSTGVWTLTGSMTGARANHTTTLLPNGKVLITGGDNNLLFLSTAEIYDPATGTWTPTGSMNFTRSSHVATLLQNGKVLVTGGGNDSDFLATAELYDPATGVWTLTGSMNGPRAVHKSILLPDGKVLVVGGTRNGPLDTAELYDPVSGTWSTTSSMNTARYGETANLLPNGSVLVAGGIGADFLNSAELYDSAPVVPPVTGNATALVVAGGGGGGGGTANGGVGGGGGAGGYKNTGLTFATGSYQITVGTGGVGGDTTGTTPGGIGGDSSIGNLITSHGGGGGGTAIATVNNIAATGGGSGGGAGGAFCHSSANLNGAGIPGEGHDGGHGGNTCFQDLGGGGGGAGEAGHNDAPYQAQPGDSLGGLGTNSTLSGAVIMYAHGGNGAGTVNPGVSGASNTGNGGNGSTLGPIGGAGGSGIVIISYPTGSLTATGGTVTTSGGNTIHTFTTGGTFTVGTSGGCTQDCPPPFEPIQPDLDTVCPGLLPTVKNLVFITHGWQDEGTSSNSWVKQEAALIQARLPDSSWGICTYDWSEGANTGLSTNPIIANIFPTAAFNNAWFAGSQVGDHLGLGNFTSIHFIAHSAGANVIQTAAESVKLISPQTKIHLTFLDAFDPTGGGRHYGLDPRNKNGQYTNYPDWWAEQYVDKRGSPILANTNLTLQDAFNADVSALDPNQDLPNLLDTDSIAAYVTRVHAWPHAWYASSTLPAIPPFSTYGFPLSRESGVQLPSQSLLAGQLCILLYNTDTCPTGPRQFSTYTALYPFLGNILQASMNGALHFSPTGTHTYPNDFSIAQFPASPVWFVLDATTTSTTNILKFDYQFLSVAGSEDILTVFVDGTIVYKIDERVTDSSLHTATEIPLGDLPAGVHTVEFRLDPFTEAKSGIQIGNIQLGFLTQTIATDTTAPTTAAAVSGTAGANGWYLGTTTVTLSATDNVGGVGVQKTNYSLDNGALLTYSTTSPIVIATEGQHTLKFYSTDNFNNQEATSTLAIKIDTTAPEAKISVSTSTQDLLVQGVDTQGTTTATKDASGNYTIKDLAGHATKLIFSKTYNGKILTLAKFTGIKYDNAATTTITTSSFVYVWDVKKTPPTLVSQTIAANSTYLIEALYNLAKSTTTVITLKKNVPVQTQTFTGLRIPKLTTEKGIIGYEI